MSLGQIHEPIVVRGIELVPKEPQGLRAQKLARILLDATSQLAALLDLEGTVLEINRTALDTAGVGASEVLGKPLWAAPLWQATESVTSELRAAVARAAAGVHVRWETALEPAGGGEPVPCELSLSPLHDERGQVALVCAELREPPAVPRSTRREAEASGASASAANARPRLLLIAGASENVREVMQALAPQHDVSQVKDAPEAVERAAQLRPALILLSAAPGQASGPGVLAELRSVPELRPVPILLLADEREPGAALELLEAGAQDSIQQPFSPRELSARVKNLLSAQDARDQLGRLRDAAAGASLARDEFIAMLGHELRNPLSPILTALEVMKLRGQAGSELERSVIERQVSHLTRLIDDLLDVSRLARGKVELKMSHVELEDVVKSAVHSVSPLFEQRAHALMVKVPRGLIVNGDPLRLGQIVCNLLSNAAKYTPRGGDISVRAERKDDQVVLSVRDSGVGIAPETLPHVFDMFVQARQGIDRSQGGLGLGLSLVRSLAERHGGSVSARSRGLGKGSEFVVRLPAVPQEPAGAGAPASATGSSSSRPDALSRVLVVDDNQDGADMLAEILSGKGYDTRVAHDAPSALRVAADFSPQVAFLDIGLPVMDGYELAGHLRKLPGLSELRLIALTGYGQESDRQRARAAGFHHHLIKPVDIALIEATLTSHGEQSAPR